MTLFRNILFVAQNITEKNKALMIAASLAKRNKALLTVVDVIKELSPYMNILPASSNASELEKQIVQDHIEQLDQLIGPYKGKGMKISRKILIGTPFLEIIRQVIKTEHDLVIITPVGHRGFSEMLFGTTTMHLMRKCPCPVWAIKPGQSEKFNRILVAVDFIPSNQINDALNRKIIEVASSFSRIYKSELHGVHVLQTEMTGVRIPLFPIHEISREARKTHEKWLHDLIKKYSPGTPESHIHLPEGEASAVIPNLVKDKQIDLIVMGTLSRTGVSGLFIGNTAEKILQRIGCSVIAVKPEGFVSPVTVD